MSHPVFFIVTMTSLLVLWCIVRLLHEQSHTLLNWRKVFPLCIQFNKSSCSPCPGMQGPRLIKVSTEVIVVILVLIMGEKSNTFYEIIWEFNC